MLAVQGPEARAIVGRARSTASCRRGCTPRALATGSAAPRCSSAAPATRARTGSRSCTAPEAAPALWDGAARRAARRRPASAPATRCGSRSASTSTATTSTHRPQPDRGRPRLVLQGGDRLHRLRGGRRGRAPTAPPEKLAPFALTEPRHPAPGQRGARRRRAGREGDQRHALALRSSAGSGWPTCAPTSPSPGPRSRSTSEASVRPARIESKPLYDPDRTEA